jgi:hypothetical protein
MSSFKPNPNLERDLKREITRNVPAEWAAAMEEVTCPRHGEHPTVVAVPDEGWSMDGCCETAKAMGREKLGWPSG